MKTEAEAFGQLVATQVRVRKPRGKSHFGWYENRTQEGAGFARPELARQVAALLNAALPSEAAAYFTDKSREVWRNYKMEDDPYAEYHSLAVAWAGSTRERLSVKNFPIGLAGSKRWRWTPEPSIPKVLVAFVGRVERIDETEQTAFVTLVNPSTGEILHSDCDIEVLRKKEIALEDEFSCTVVRRDGDTTVEFSRLPFKNLSEKQIDEILSSVDSEIK